MRGGGEPGPEERDPRDARPHERGEPDDDDRDREPLDPESSSERNTTPPIAASERAAAAGERVREREVAVVVRADERADVHDVHDARRDEERQRVGAGHPDHEQHGQEQQAADEELAPRGEEPLVARLDEEVPRRVQDRRARARGASPRSRRVTPVGVSRSSRSGSRRTARPRARNISTLRRSSSNASCRSKP